MSYESVRVRREDGGFELVHNVYKKAKLCDEYYLNGSWYLGNRNIDVGIEVAKCTDIYGLDTYSSEIEVAVEDLGRFVSYSIDYTVYGERAEKAFSVFREVFNRLHTRRK